jgi:hypothetical protein
MTESVLARVVGVHPYANTIGLAVTYDGLEEELALINKTVLTELDLAPPHKVTPGEPHVSLLVGGNVAQYTAYLQERIPPTIELSRVKQT